VQLYNCTISIILELYFGKHDPGLSELNLFEIVTKLEKGGSRSTTEISWHEEIDPSAATTSTSSALAS